MVGVPWDTLVEGGVPVWGGVGVVEGELPMGEIVPVHITGAMAYDLSGRVETGRSVIGLSE
ncbi:MAG TPA: hypothetical protein VF498_17870, partial [Anaerolineales bacterium]